MTDTITQTLTDRGNRYGLFIGHAEVTQRLKRVMAEELAKRGKPLAARANSIDGAALEGTFRVVGKAQLPLAH